MQAREFSSLGRSMAEDYNFEVNEPEGYYWVGVLGYARQRGTDILHNLCPKDRACLSQFVERILDRRTLQADLHLGNCSYSYGAIPNTDSKAKGLWVTSDDAANYLYVSGVADWSDIVEIRMSEEYTLYCRAQLVESLEAYSHDLDLIEIDSARIEAKEMLMCAIAIDQASRKLRMIS
jgi:hypothetical protein